MARSKLGPFKPMDDFDWSWPAKIDRPTIWLFKTGPPSFRMPPAQQRSSIASSTTQRSLPSKGRATAAATRKKTRRSGPNAVRPRRRLAPGSRPLGQISAFPSGRQQDDDYEVRNGLRCTNFSLRPMRGTKVQRKGREMTSRAVEYVSMPATAKWLRNWMSDRLIRVFQSRLMYP